jgi:hypothetical protein
MGQGEIIVQSDFFVFYTPMFHRDRQHDNPIQSRNLLPTPIIQKSPKNPAHEALKRQRFDSGSTAQHILLFGLEYPLTCFSIAKQIFESRHLRKNVCACWGIFQCRFHFMSRQKVGFLRNYTLWSHAVKRVFQPAAGTPFLFLGNSHAFTGMGH